MGKITLEKISSIDGALSLYEDKLYLENIRRLVGKALPEIFYNEFQPNAFLLNEKKKNINEALPLIKWSDIDTLSSNLSVILLCKQRKGAGLFFYDLITRWLMPGRNLSGDLFFVADFLFEGIEEVFTVAEVVLEISSEEVRLEVLKNKRTIETEIRLGATSDFHANRIMQFKGLSYDKKTSMIQEKIASLIRSRSKDFGRSIFSHMQQFLVICSDQFKVQRDYHHISRIISILFVTKKILIGKVKDFPDKRHVNLKFLKTKIYSDNGEKEVLGIIVGLNFVKEHEVFEKQHLLKATRVFIPEAVEVSHSFFIEKNSDSGIQTIYFEVEKSSKADFTFEEIRKLKLELPSEIKVHIESLTHRIFMPRNEEEIARNILILSRQLKFVNDIPQVIISFDEQVQNDLSFTVILLRILKPKSLSVQEMFRLTDTSLKFVHDRVKKVGILRRKHLKEANVFKVLISGKNYRRKDLSFDLNKARIDVIGGLNKIFSEVRDYNGRLIYKQNEALTELRESLSQARYNDLLLEKFFYSIRPLEMGVIISSFSLKSLFLMLSNAIKREENRIKRHNDYLFKKEPRAVYAIIPIYDGSRKKYVKETISKYYLLSSDFISLDLSFNDIHYLGYIFNCEDDIRQKNFLKLVQQVLDFEIKRS